MNQFTIIGIALIVVGLVLAYIGTQMIMYARTEVSCQCGITGAGRCPVCLTVAKSRHT